MRASNKNSILILSVLVLSVLLLASCGVLVVDNREVYSSDYWSKLRSPSNTEVAINYLFSDIVPYLDANTKEEITRVFANAKVNNIFAIRNNDSVTITNYYSILMVNISKSGITISLSCEMPVWYEIGSNATLYLLGDNSTRFMMELENHITREKHYLGDGTSYYFEYVKDLVLPDAWKEYLISCGDGGVHSGRFSFVGSPNSYTWDFHGLNISILRIAYLVDQYFKNYSSAKANVSSKLKSLGTIGSSVLGKIESGQVSLYVDTGAERIKADNIILEQADNDVTAYLCDDLPPDGIRAANVFCDGEQFFVMEANAYIVNGSFEYPIADSELIQALTSAKAVYIEYYDDGYMTIMEKDLITSDDKLLLRLYSIM